jgi:hypothetical protein
MVGSLELMALRHYDVIRGVTMADSGVILCVTLLEKKNWSRTVKIRESSHFSQRTRFQYIMYQTDEALSFEKTQTAPYSGSD